MQLMWMAGPTSSVKSISITRRRMALGATVTALSLVMLGMMLHFVGFRIAIEIDPAMARRMGGVTTEQEQQRVEKHYRLALDQLRQELNQTLQQLSAIEEFKSKVLGLTAPLSVKKRKPQAEDPQGGPALPARIDLTSSGILALDLSQSLAEFAQVRASAEQMGQSWRDQQERLHSIPMGRPIQGPHQIASGFGIRHDPFDGHLAMHEGLDFVAEPDTPVLATAQGVVVRSEKDATYGQVVDVRHSEGYTTRYAHLNQRLVRSGDLVERGQTLGLLGSTGRSTGPHLHYEVMRHERHLDPRLLLGKAVSTATP